MTTDAEREFYYRLVKERAFDGNIVEFGAWLGASTAYIAAALRDSGLPPEVRKVKVYDKFLSKPGHVRKVQEFYHKQGQSIPTGPSLEQFKANLGPLLEHVEIHPGQIEDMKWGVDDGPIAVLITDAPKRIPAISAVLTALRGALIEGSIMAWQDFCHFPSYEIPACLYRLRHHLEFVEAVVPGTTLAFRVACEWSKQEVSLDALSLVHWTPAEIAQAWDYWAEFVPPEKADLFKCGRAMFLCDIGYPQEAKVVLASVQNAPDVVKKWDYLRRNRADFVARYHPLFKLMAKAA